MHGKWRCHGGEDNRASAQCCLQATHLPSLWQIPGQQRPPSGAGGLQLGALPPKVCKEPDLNQECMSTIYWALQWVHQSRPSSTYCIHSMFETSTPTSQSCLPRSTVLS